MFFSIIKVSFKVGVARKAGLSYRGCRVAQVLTWVDSQGLVLTPEGAMPGPEHADAVAAAIARADMKPWELEATSNPPAPWPFDLVSSHFQA